MTKQEALDYCYKHEDEYKSDLCGSGEDGQSQFDCLIADIRCGIVKPSELSDYGMDY